MDIIWNFVENYHKARLKEDKESLAFSTDKIVHLNLPKLVIQHCFFFS
jgi:hypothetical protein